MFFALELILRNFDTESFGFVVLSSVTADAIGRAVFGSHPFLTLPGFTFTSPLELVLYAGLGVLAVGVGMTFIRVLTPARISPTDSGADRAGCGQRLAESCSGCCCSRSRKCMASATRFWSAPSAGST